MESFDVGCAGSTVTSTQRPHACPLARLGTAPVAKTATPMRTAHLPTLFAQGCRTKLTPPLRRLERGIAHLLYSTIFTQFLLYTSRLPETPRGSADLDRLDNASRPGKTTRHLLARARNPRGSRAHKAPSQDAVETREGPTPRQEMPPPGRWTLSPPEREGKAVRLQS